jgi:hypothetical protein
MIKLVTSIMSLALTGKQKEKAEAFYNEILEVLLDKNLPFMIGGTFAFNEYTDLDRPTGDIDIKTTTKDYPRLLRALARAGFETELSEIELKWLAKVKKGDFYTDIIFAERNGLHKIDQSWLDRSRLGTVLGHEVKIEPVEELVRSKMYVQNRDRNDMIDVVNLLLKQGKSMDWNLLYQKMEPHWELLMSAVLTFIFVYPSERNNVPTFIFDKLMDNLKERLSHDPTPDKITRGLLLSNDYEVGVSKWGFQPIHTLK